jgi:hypothetical protein
MEDVTGFGEIQNNKLFFKHSEEHKYRRSSTKQDYHFSLKIPV